MKLIFAQGNPGLDYERTRHNVGFMVLDAYAVRHSLAWSPKTKFHADIAETTIDGEKALLVKPTTFYNETGLAAKALVDFYKLDPSTDVLVIHDDFALPLGTIRIREQGRDAGNNGIKSLNSHLGAAYYRMRIGIWSELRNRMNDVDFVLAKFSKEEMEHLMSDIIPHATKLIDAFCHDKLEVTSHTL